MVLSQQNQDNVLGIYVPNPLYTAAPPFQQLFMLERLQEGRMKHVWSVAVFPIIQKRKLSTYEYTLSRCIDYLLIKRLRVIIQMISSSDSEGWSTVYLFIWLPHSISDHMPGGIQVIIVSAHVIECLPDYFLYIVWLFSRVWVFLLPCKDIPKYI